MAPAGAPTRISRAWEAVMKCFQIKTGSKQKGLGLLQNGRGLRQEQFTLFLQAASGGNLWFLWSSGAIRDFYDQWNDNSLVLDRWFAAQSVSSLPNGVERVKQLMNHEKFSLSNPNKLRSVVSSFCVGNPEQFHNPDGSGYRFLGDVIRKVDRQNPQMGAAMTKIFLDWTKYDASRRNMIKNELELILNNVDKLFKNCLNLYPK